MACPSYVLQLKIIHLRIHNCYPTYNLLQLPIKLESKFGQTKYFHKKQSTCHWPQPAHAVGPNQAYCGSITFNNPSSIFPQVHFLSQQPNEPRNDRKHIPMRALQSQCSRFRREKKNNWSQIWLITAYNSIM